MTREQFITCVEGSQAALRRFLTALCCGDSALADDIAQETYLKAFMACDGLNAPEKFNAWIFRIGYNTFVNHKRTERTHTGYDDAAAVASSAETDGQFRYQELYTALDRIPPHERISVLLYYMEGYSIKEIADIESTSPDAVKQHLSRGRKHLKQLLSND